VRLTQRGWDVLEQSLHNEVDKRIFSVLTAEERDRLAIWLSRLRQQALTELGVTDVELSVKYVPTGQAGGQTVS
jgi:hypothetical protein